MSLDLAHEKLGWPSSEEILRPPGEGARIFADLAKAKIGESLNRQLGGANARVGVLTPNPNSSATASPLAVVCEFQHAVSDQTLRELQGLAWNFSRCPMLVTVEPHQLRAWTCCEPPSDQLLSNYVVHELQSSDLTSGLSQQATQVLHWINLVSGQFFKDNSAKFRRDQRADQMLLENLSFVRQELHDKGLINDDICHDLLARVIFIQFLFDRKDSSGNSALNESRLERLFQNGVLKAKHSTLANILSDYEDCYRLFSWLNDKFNGDLFPSKGNTEAERELAWQAEKREVKQPHLNVLSDLVSGDLHMPTGQMNLWRKYAFDAIPLEFISSIYEAFVTNPRGSGTYYTPPHLVDFVLDRVLPWEGDQWNLKVLDPACGSGVFLVKAFQRLVHRWKNAHPGETIRAETLRSLLENNLFGVDKDRHAVRVASFSLYLAMCDEIDPKHYWTQVRFPLMRGQRLIKADFFKEDFPGFQTREDKASYDLVTGNAPWGEKTSSIDAKNWANDNDHKWPIADKGIGPLFLPKAAALVKPDGKVAMIQPAGSLLFNRSSTASEFRNKFFTTFRVEQVINLSALRFKVFKKKNVAAQKTTSPTCVVVFGPQPMSNDRISYISPKAIDDITEALDIIIEPADVKEVHPIDGANDPDIWTALMWGSHRDFSLVRWLRRLPNLKSLKKEKRLNYPEGIIRGKNPKRRDEYSWLLDRPILEAPDFPPDTFLHLRADQLPKNEDAWAERPRTEQDFSSPQLLIKQSWSTKSKRFQARLIVPDQQGRGAICTQSFLSVCSKVGDVEVLEGACLTYNSYMAVYFLLLTSGRFASYRPEALATEIPRIPIPNPQPGLLDGLKTINDIDKRVRKAFALKPAEWVLIEDMCQVTLEDFKGGLSSPGRQLTRRSSKPEDEPELKAYCDHFISVLKAGFGQDKQISATIFQEKEKDWLPFRLVAFQLDQASVPSIQVEPIESPDLLAELEALNKTWLKSTKANSGNIYHQRVARIYDVRNNVPTIFMIKPDACRYWTRSMGLNDADEVAADLVGLQSMAVRGGRHG